MRLIQRQRRSSLRLKGYDYSRAGAYYVTICAHHRVEVFGEVVNGVMNLNEVGLIAQQEWLRTEQRSEVALDEYIIMPNHIHAILWIITEEEHDMGEILRRGMACPWGMARHAPTDPPFVERQFGKPIPHSLSSIIGSFKSAVTRAIRNVLSGMRATVWQRQFYDHVVRNEADLHRIREYIWNNPARWDCDREREMIEVHNAPIT